MVGSRLRLDARRCFHFLFRGSILTSRLSVYFPDRFIGFAFLGVAYSPPRPKFNYEEALAQATKFIGFEAIGYWSFFNEDDAAQTIEEHVRNASISPAPYFTDTSFQFESFYSILFASDAKLWKTNLAPLGALKAWLLEDKKTETASYLSEEVIGFCPSPLCPLFILDF